MVILFKFMWLFMKLGIMYSIWWGLILKCVNSSKVYLRWKLIVYWLKWNCRWIVLLVFGVKLWKSKMCWKLVIYKKYWMLYRLLVMIDYNNSVRGVWYWIVLFMVFWCNVISGLNGGLIVVIWIVVIFLLFVNSVRILSK